MAASDIPAPPAPSWPQAATAWFSLAVMTLAYTLSFVDRIILTMLVGPIKAALHLSDTQVSFLTGISFALFYTVLGLPIGWLVDRRERRLIATAGVLVWSLMTVLCGAARSFALLMLARIGVGAGEAALSPAAYSLIPDLFRPASRGRAQGVYGMGASLGSGFAYLVGGWVIATVSQLHPIRFGGLGEIGGWRAAFVAVGLPGVLVAALVLMTREPPRQADLAVEVAPSPSLLRSLARNWRAYLPMILGVPLINIAYHGLIAWGPTYLGRVFHLTHGQIGLLLGPIFIVGGCSGLYVGGAVTDRWVRRGRLDANLRTAMIGAGGGGATLALLILHPALPVAIGILAVAVFLITMTFGAAPNALNLVIPNLMRGRMSAAYMLALNLIGQGVGPTAVALLTDYSYRTPLSVGVSMGTVGLVSAVAAVTVIAFGKGAYASLAGQRPTA